MEMQIKKARVICPKCLSLMLRFNEYHYEARPRWKCTVCNVTTIYPYFQEIRNTKKFSEEDNAIVDSLLVDEFVDRRQNVDMAKEEMLCEAE